MIAYAKTADGLELPVLDITHPAFQVDDSPEAIETLRRDFKELERHRRRVPGFLMRFFLRSAAKKSRLARALLTPQDAVLDSLSTYVIKLGADHLPPLYDSSIDKKLASSPAGTAMRLRVQQVAKLTAEGLTPQLEKDRQAHLHLLNIGAGTAIDSLNTLLLLRSSRPELLMRPVTIHVLDLDSRGPAFGKNALDELSVRGGPLYGLEVHWLHQRYSWEDTLPLEQLLHGLSAQHSIIAASSEGALFEYPGDEIVVANLRALYADGRGARVVTGSVTRADELTRATLAVSLFNLQPRGVDGFAALIRGTGYRLARAELGLMGDQVLLLPEDA